MNVAILFMFVDDIRSKAPRVIALIGGFMVNSRDRAMHGIGSRYPGLVPITVLPWMVVIGDER